MNDRVIGSAEFELRATRDKLKRDLADAERDLKQATGHMEADANRAANGISGGMNKIGAAIAGVITFATAAAVAFVAVGKASIEMAANIADSAKRIGVSTDTLQEFQFAARKAGGDIGDAEAAIGSFEKKFAAAAAGLSKSDLNAFKALGFTQEQLRSFKSSEEAFEAVIGRIGDLKSETDRVAAAGAVGLGELSDVLRETGDEVAATRDEAQALGHVMDESLVQRGAAAQSALEDLSSVISVDLAEAFVHVSDEVVAFAGFVGDAIAKLNDLASSYDRWRDRANFTGDAFDDTERRALMFGAPGALFAVGRNRTRAGLRRLSGEQDQREADYAAGFGDADDPALVRQSMAAKDYNRRQRDQRTPGRDYLTPYQGTPRVDRSAEREARRAERIEQEIYRARQRLLETTDDELLTVQQRFDLARQSTLLEREARDKKLERDIAQKEIKGEEINQLRLINQQTDALEDRVANDILARDLSEERLAQERLLGDMTVELLSLQSSAARTVEERRRIEFALLQDAQRRAREDLERSSEYLRASPERQDELRRMQDRLFAAQNAATDRANQFPLDAWRDASLQSAAEVQEAFERIAVDGLDALNDGLVDAIMNSRDLGEVFSSVARSILADLLKISVRRGITEPLANLLFPQQGGGVAGTAGNIFSTVSTVLRSMRIPGFATGVTDFSGGLAYVHQGEVLANLAPGTDVIPAHAVAGLGGKGAVHVTVSTNDDRFNAYVDGRAAPQAAAAFQGARNTVPADMARTSRYTRGRRR